MEKKNVLSPLIAEREVPMYVNGLARILSQLPQAAKPGDQIFLLEGPFRMVLPSLRTASVYKALVLLADVNEGYAACVCASDLGLPEQVGQLKRVA